MSASVPTYYITLDELAIAFAALPANADGQLLLVGLTIQLPGNAGEFSAYRLVFEWNDRHQDWQLSTPQDLVIQAKQRV